MGWKCSTFSNWILLLLHPKQRKSCKGCVRCDNHLHNNGSDQQGKVLQSWRHVYTKVYKGLTKFWMAEFMACNKHTWSWLRITIQQSHTYGKLHCRLGTEASLKRSVVPSYQSCAHVQLWAQTWSLMMLWNWTVYNSCVKHTNVYSAMNKQKYAVSTLHLLLSSWEVDDKMGTYIFPLGKLTTWTWDPEQDLLQTFPPVFTAIGQFDGTYKLRENSKPVQHGAPRCISRITQTRDP